MRDDSDDWIITKGPNGTRISVRRSELTRNPEVDLREKIAKARKTVPKPVVDPFKDKPKVKEIHAAQVSYDEERSRRTAYSQAAAEERRNSSCMQELAIAVLVVTVVLMILMSR